MKLTLRRVIQDHHSDHCAYDPVVYSRQPACRDLMSHSLRSLFVFTIIYAVAQAAFYWVFVNFLSWLPTVLYPLVMFVVNGILIAVVGNRI